MDTKTVKDFPLAKYAAEHWVAHAQFQDVASHVKHGMKDLFDPEKPYFATWIGTHDMDSGGLFCTRPTPLYYSSLRGFRELTKDLSIKYPQYANAIGGRYDFPLLAALSQGHVEVAELLCEHGGDVDARGTRGRTQLYTSLSSSYLDRNFSRSVLFLLEHRADPNLRCRDGKTPLHILFSHLHGNDVLPVALLLLEHRADPNLKSKDGETPLQILLGGRQSFLSGYPNYNGNDILLVVKLLLEHGADVNPRHKGRKTPIRLALRHEAFNAARCFLDHGADPDSEHEEGKTPLHKLLGPQHCGLCSYYYPPDFILAIAQLLLERGADVNAQDNDHKTPLLLAIQHGTSDIVSFLLEHGADPNMEDNEGNTLLHTLLLERDKDKDDDDVLILQSLLKLGTDTSARNKNHATPLDLASYYGKVLIAQVLLDHANVLEGEYPHCNNFVAVLLTFQ